MPTVLRTQQTGKAKTKPRKDDNLLTPPVYTTNRLRDNDVVDSSYCSYWQIKAIYTYCFSNF